MGGYSNVLERFTRAGHPSSGGSGGSSPGSSRRVLVWLLLAEVHRSHGVRVAHSRLDSDARVIAILSSVAGC